MKKTQLLSEKILVLCDARYELGLSEGIRTPGPLTPNQARCQTALRSDTMFYLPLVLFSTTPRTETSVRGLHVPHRRQQDVVSDFPDKSPRRKRK